MTRVARCSVSKPINANSDDPLPQRFGSPLTWCAQTIRVRAPVRRNTPEAVSSSAVDRGHTQSENAESINAAECTARRQIILLKFEHMARGKQP
jgi:hypothetical protein